ncbi:MAG TPA: hypothetical protein VGG19_19965 [Tepidisphaeraceae bacterium]|jgi:hypothetical protein
MNKTVAQIISRIAMAIVGAAMIYGGIWCFRVESMVVTAGQQFDPHAHYVGLHRSFPLPVTIGLGLIGVGIMCLLAAALPLAMVESLFTFMGI